MVSLYTPIGHPWRKRKLINGNDNDNILSYFKEIIYYPQIIHWMSNLSFALLEQIGAILG